VTEGREVFEKTRSSKVWPIARNLRGKVREEARRRTVHRLNLIGGKQSHEIGARLFKIGRLVVKGKAGVPSRTAATLETGRRNRRTNMFAGSGGQRVGKEEKNWGANQS